MTIINPSKRGNNFIFIVFLFGIFLFSGIFYIYQYNRLVDMRHRIASLENSLIKAEVVNTDFKNKLYQIVDPLKLKEAAAGSGLVLDSRPDYLDIGKWLSDSSR